MRRNTRLNTECHSKTPNHKNRDWKDVKLRTFTASKTAGQWIKYDEAFFGVQVSMDPENIFDPVAACRGISYPRITYNLS